MNIRDEYITDEGEWNDLIYGAGIGDAAGAGDMVLLSDEMEMETLDFREYINVEWISE